MGCNAQAIRTTRVGERGPEFRDLRHFDSLNRAQTIAWKLNATEKSAHLTTRNLGACASFEMSSKQFKGPWASGDYLKMLTI